MTVEKINRGEDDSVSSSILSSYNMNHNGPSSNLMISPNFNDV